MNYNRRFVNSAMSEAKMVKIEIKKESKYNIFTGFMKTVKNVGIVLLPYLLAVNTELLGKKEAVIVSVLIYMIKNYVENK